MIENGDDPDPKYLNELEQAKVYKGCDCGCESIDFQIGDRPPNYSGEWDIISDWLYRGSGEEELFGAYLFTYDGHLAGLDLCTYAGPPAKLPKTEDLLPIEGNLPNQAVQ